MLKEAVIPSHSNKFLFLLAPVLSLTVSFLGWAVIPFGSGLTLADISLGIMYVLAVSSLGVYGVILAGWSANSKYAFLGGLRSTAQIVSYEVVLGLIVLTVVVCVGSLNLTDIVLAQQAVWFIIPLLPLSLMFLISAIAETNRAPFDLPEAKPLLFYSTLLIIYVRVIDLVSINIIICCKLFISNYTYYFTVTINKIKQTARNFRNLTFLLESSENLRDTSYNYDQDKIHIYLLLFFILFIFTNLLNLYYLPTINSFIIINNWKFEFNTLLSLFIILIKFDLINNLVYQYPQPWIIKNLYTSSNNSKMNISDDKVYQNNLNQMDTIEDLNINTEETDQKTTPEGGDPHKVENLQAFIRSEHTEIIKDLDNISELSKDLDNLSNKLSNLSKEISNILNISEDQLKLSNIISSYSEELCILSKSLKTHQLKYIIKPFIRPEPADIFKNLLNKDYLLSTKNKAGIYGLVNTITGQIYVGSSNNLGARITRHLSGHHSNINLQQSFDRYGLNAFNLIIFEYYNKGIKHNKINTIMDSTLKKIENIYIQSFKEKILFNIKNSKLSFERYFEQEKFLQEYNPLNLKRFYSEETKALISRATTGENNPRYGAILTNETKGLISKALSKTPVDVCDLNGTVLKIFPNQVLLAEWLNVHKSTVGRYLRIGNIYQNKYIFRKHQEKNSR